MMTDHDNDVFKKHMNTPVGKPIKPEDEETASEYFERIAKQTQEEKKQKELEATKEFLRDEGVDDEDA